MRLLTNLSVTAKITLLMTIMSLVSTVVTLTASVRLSHISNDFVTLTTKDFPAAAQLSAANRAAVEMAYAGYRTTAYGSADTQAKIASSMSRFTFGDASDAMQQAAALAPAQRTDIEALRKQLATIHDRNQSAVRAALAGDHVQAKRKLADVDLRLARFSDDIGTLEDSLKSRVEERSEQLSREATQTLILLAACWALASLIFAGLGVAIGQWGISRPLKRLTERVATLASGDNARGIPGFRRKDELGTIARALGTFRLQAIEKTEIERAKAGADAERAVVVDLLSTALGQLADRDLTISILEPVGPEYVDIVGDFNAALAELHSSMHLIEDATAGISVGAHQIHVASGDLSRRTALQATSLESSAAAMDEVTVSVQSSAKSAQEVSRLVEIAQRDADDGGSVVREAIAAMDGIAAMSDEIGQIVSLIDGIAFQTNLLALNAGVEAARAGDAGRGFAVVASEVRALAQRSAEAAGNIKGLIGNARAQVADGVLLVGRTGQSLDRICQRVAEINDLATEIAQATIAQALSIDHLNLAITEIDRSTQENASMVEETNAAVGSLRGASQGLSALVGKFRLERSVGDQGSGRRHSRRKREIAAIKSEFCNVA